MSSTVETILSDYPCLTEKQRTSFQSLLTHGATGNTGKLVILPVDQGFEHGPGRTFEPNSAGYDPRYHARIASESGCSAYAAPLGALEACPEFLSSCVPLILKVNSSDLMMPNGEDPKPAITSWVDDAVRLRCVAVGMTIYPGSVHSGEMYEDLRKLVKDSRRAGLIVVVWAYPRGSGLLSKKAETAADVVAYAVHVACQLGAHIVKCKPTTCLYGMPDNERRGIYKSRVSGEGTLAQRTELVTNAAFGGRRLVINSGGDMKDESAILEEIRQLKSGGSSGSIMGRNAFQRPFNEALGLLGKVQQIWIT